MHGIFHSVIRAEAQLFLLYSFTGRHDRLQGLHAVIELLLIPLLLITSSSEIPR
jgi:hypothetical protein